MSMKSGICGLCKNEAQLCESHIIPEVFYTKLYDSQGRALGITGVGHKKSAVVQKGLRDYLLCKDCETLRNRDVEQPYMAQWQLNNETGNKLLPDESIVLKFDHDIFIRYHLYILFLASIAATPDWSEVSLGVHEERIRKYLFDGTMLDPSLFSVAGTLMVEKDGTAWDRVVFPPRQYRLFNQRCYGLTFGGVRWGYCISSHRNRHLEAVSIDKNGNFPLMSSLYSEHQHVHDAGRALQ